MKCPWCDREFKPKNPNQKFCCKQHGTNFRGSGGVSKLQIRNQQEKAFIKEMLGVEGSVYSFKIGGSK